MFNLIRRLKLTVVGACLLAGLATSARAEQASDQLNQLFRLDATPNKSAAKEFWVGTRVAYFGGPHDADAVRWALEGEYGLTDQIAVGTRTGLIDYVSAGNNDETSFGDIIIYGKYNFNKLINPNIITLSAQVGMILPTANSKVSPLDKGKFGVEGLILAYKDFGVVGPGILGAYGQIGANLASTNSDFRWGLGATYEWKKFVGSMEFRGQVGKDDQNLIDFTPGVFYRGVKHLEVGLGVPIGITDESEDIGVEIVANFAFGK